MGKSDSGIAVKGALLSFSNSVSVVDISDQGSTQFVNCTIPARALIMEGEASVDFDPRMSLIKAAFLQKLSTSAESISLPLG